MISKWIISKVESIKEEMVNTVWHRGGSVLKIATVEWRNYG